MNKTTKLPKTKIIRVRGGEIYFQQVAMADSAPMWELMRKDTSAIIASYRETKFKAQGSVFREPALPSYLEAILPVPEGFAADLLKPFAALEYAKGHEPIKSFRMR